MSIQATSTGAQKARRRVTLSPRQRRTLGALMLRSISTLELSRIAGALNAPDVVMRLRAKGLTIPCTLSRVRTRDGCTVCPGTYSLTPADREQAARLLADVEGCGHDHIE